MNKVEVSSLNMHYFEDILPNGLRVVVIPKTGFSKSFAMLSTNYGSIDSVFEVDGKWENTPDGVAHFLEHKVFEQPDGTNALQLFSETGASPNAFTSHTMTAYHFECTEEFDRNLEILLDYVYSPYFTDENVEKEQGIIGQEIGMIEDNPHWCVYVNLFKCLYENHTINRSIAGTVQSIADITKDTLYLCHKSFYSPSNMLLCVCGDVDPQSVFDKALKLTPKESTKISDRDYGDEPKAVYKSEEQVSMAVSTPLFMLGFKDDAPTGDKLHYDIIAEIAASCLCSTSTAFYKELYESGIINRSFESEYMQFRGGGMLIFAGESRQPHEVRKKIEQELVRISKEGIEKKLFERVARTSYGMRIRSIDSVAGVCHSFTSAYFDESNFFDFDKIYDKITVEDVQNFLAKFIEENRSALSIVNALNS